MSFQIIKAEDRVASMIDWFTGICQSITDFVVGSKIRTKFETIAVEMEAQDFAWYQALKKAIPIAIYQAFDFSLIPAQKSSGEVTFYIPDVLTSSVIIPSGTRVSNGSSSINTEIFFETSGMVTILPGTLSITAPVVSVESGVQNNLDSYTIDTVVTVLNGVSLSVANETPITKGSDRETETERRLRFIEYVATLSRGTIRAVEYGAKTAVVYDENGEALETVHDAIIYEPFMHDISKPVGIFECYIYNGSGNTSEDLKDAVEQAVYGYYDADGNPVPGWKAAGVICNVFIATETTLDVTASITTLSGYDAATTESTAINVADAYIAGLGIGKEFIYNELIERLMGIPGVYNVDITEPATDLTPTYKEVYIPGTKTITVTSL